MISLLAAAVGLSGSYRGSYFSMDGFRIAEIGCRCRLVSKLVSLHNFALGCRRRRLVSPSLSPFITSLLAAAAALSPQACLPS